jgi:NAD(P)-dependent dehydrogenase (short-subunit alcohol dehydrogenase family)
MTTENKTWLITGAGRGMGVNIAKAALAAGHNVVATGRNPDAVAEAVGDSDRLLVAKLDDLRPGLDRGLRRARRRPARALGERERQPERRPPKLAQALLTIADQKQPPFRFIAGADAIAQAEQKLAERRQHINAYRDLTSSLALDEAETAATSQGATLS